MESSLSVPFKSINSILTDPSSSLNSGKIPTRPHSFTYWILNDRLRSRNRKLSRRQQSSCRIAFYSLTLCVVACVMSIVIYRFTDECLLANDQTEFSIECSRHRLYLLSIAIGCLACIGLLFGACRYCCSQPRTLITDEEFQRSLLQPHRSLLTTSPSHSCPSSASVVNETSTKPSERVRHDRYEPMNPSTTNQSIEGATNPPTESPLPVSDNLKINEKSPLEITSREVYSSTLIVSVSSPPPTSTTAMSLGTDTSTSNDKTMLSRAMPSHACSSTPTPNRACLCRVDVWQRQEH